MLARLFQDAIPRPDPNRNSKFIEGYFKGILRVFTMIVVDKFNLVSNNPEQKQEARLFIEHFLKVMVLGTNR